MSKLKVIAALALSVGLAACSQTSLHTQLVQGTCLAAATALESAAANIERLSTDHIVRIQTVNDTIVRPICAQQEQPKWEELVVGRLDQAVKVITGAE